MSPPTRDLQGHGLVPSPQTFPWGSKMYPSSHIFGDAQRQRLYLPPRSGALGTRVVTSCSDWGSLESSCVSFILKLFWDRPVSSLRLGLSGWSFVAPVAASLCLGQEFSARQVIKFLRKSNVES